MYLVDTDVLSLLRKPERSPDVSRWMAGQRTTDLFMRVVSVAEIERGITRQRRRDPTFASLLAAWLDTVLSLYGNRILPIDTSIARRWGRLSGDLGHEGTDLLIAATAIEHGLTVVTCNVRHFDPTGVPVLDPSVPHR